jgi:hypothetical protein
MDSIPALIVGCLMTLLCCFRLVQSFVRPRPNLRRVRWTTFGWSLLIVAVTLSAFGQRWHWQPSQPRDALEAAAFLSAGAGMAIDAWLGRVTAKNIPDA